jgi:hypothetical protein
MVSNRLREGTIVVHKIQFLAIHLSLQNAPGVQAGPPVALICGEKAMVRSRSNFIMQHISINNHEDFVF